AFNEPIYILKAMMNHIGMLENYLMDLPVEQIVRAHKRKRISETRRVSRWILLSECFRNAVAERPVTTGLLVKTDGKLLTAAGKRYKTGRWIERSYLPIGTDLDDCRLFIMRGAIVYPEDIHDAAIRRYNGISLQPTGKIPI